MRCFLLIFTLLLTPISYADNDICSAIDELAAIKIKQGIVSQSLFGIKRSQEEIVWLEKVQNIILNQKINNDFYVESQKCIDQLKKRKELSSVKRNLNIVELDLLYNLGNSSKRRFLSHEYEKQYNFALENTETSDYILIVSVNRVLGVFNTTDAADALFDFILNSNNRLGNRRLAMDSLFFMNSDYSKNKLIELKKIVDFDINALY